MSLQQAVAGKPINPKNDRKIMARLQGPRLRCSMVTMKIDTSSQILRR
jgi:hypothetical protein